MRHPSPRTLAALLLALAGSAVAQSRVDVGAGAAVAPSGSAAGAAITSGAGAQNVPGMSPSLTSPAGLTASPMTGAAPAAATPPGSVAPASLSPAVAPAGASAVRPSAGTVSPAPAQAAPAAVVSPGPAATPAAAQAARSASEHSAAAERSAAASPAAKSDLGGAAKRVAEAKAAAAAGGDSLSVSRALDRVFDAQAAAPSLKTGPAGASGVEGKAQTIRAAVAQKVSIANTSSPADAPSLYQDAIKTAKDALPAPVADAVAAVVRGFATRKADASLGELATSAYEAAASGSASETVRRLSAFDKWETLLGAPGKPLISNAPALKSDVQSVLDKASSGASPSVPHVWFAKKGGSYAAVLPGSGVAAVPALAAAFAIAPAALAPETALGDAYRAFAADPRAATGAGLVYRARRTLGSSVPAAALSAGRFWLRALLSSAWRRFVALFGVRSEYKIAQKSGQEALRRDAASAETARAEAASAARLLASDRLTAGALRAAFGALARASAALETVTGSSDASSAVAALSRSFEREASSAGLKPADAWPAAGAAFVSAPGGPAHWAARIQDEAARAVDARVSPAAAGFVNLGAEASSAAEAAKSISGGAAVVALDDHLWARGRGSNGEARLAADLRPTPAGGSVELSVERADAALARRLEDLGFSVDAAGSGLRASIGSEDFSRDGAELGQLASRALSAALGGSEAPAADAGLRALAEETRRDPASSAKLAALFDGREAFARAPVVGLVGEYEALAPTSVSAGGKPLVVSALRDPDTGLLAYARAAKPDGAPLGAAELRALLRAK